ncbi:MAG: hypothetical protein GY863_12270 [bacterium]|nr:hypothetical protein [bacterium]
MFKIRKYTVLLILTILVLTIFSEVSAQRPADAIFKDMKWRGIGPANMSGRVTDIQALDDDYRHVLVASASGGVWKSVNAGTTWEPIFDTYGAASIGAIAVYQKNPDIIWVGTGEANVRNSVGWGDGVYKSTDGGRTFENVGLKDSHHISKITVHPDDPDVAYVASQGHLWGHTGERGLYKTTNGGRTWNKLGGGLPDDGMTGCNDIKMHPEDPNILYAAFWKRLRKPYRFDSGGPNGGIFKSNDGGRTWNKLTNGIPAGDIGRIGISIYKSDPKVIMAIIEHGFQPTRNDNDYYDMNKAGTGIYRTENGGESWKFVNRYNNRPFYYSQIFVNPVDDSRVYAMGGSAQVSEDEGKTFKTGMPGIAGDFHVMWLDPHNKDRYYVGNDKGVSITHDHGKNFNFFNNYAIGQIYNVSADMRDPYYVYCGLQDNGIWGAPSNSRDFNGILNDHWFKFHSGDGFYSASDPLDWTTFYSESQGGALRRNHALFRQNSVRIQPDSSNTINWLEMIPEETDPARPVVRRNWNTPFLISHYNPHTLYYGANFLFKSVDRGDHWKIISPDLSTNDPVKTNRESGGLTRDVTSAETHCTIVTISESKIKTGLIWAGTDDGNIHVTTDDGDTWTEVGRNIRGIPKELYISRIEASHFDENTCYVTIDGHRSDVFEPFVYKTTDMGITWQSIKGDLPGHEVCYVIREDMKNKNLLFLGTELTAYASVDGGNTWNRIMNGMPTVAVHDLLIHPRDNDLIAGTHGRSMFIMDDITPLQQLSDEVLNTEFHLFSNPVSTIWQGVSRGATRGHQLYIGQNPLSMTQIPPSNSPTRIRNSATVNFYVRESSGEKIRIEITDLEGNNVSTALVDAAAGVNRYRWNLQFDPTEEEIIRFKERMEVIFGKLRDVLKVNDLKDRLEEIYREYQKASTVEEFSNVRSKLSREFRGIMSDRRFFGDGLRGMEAGPGVYNVKMTFKGNLYSGTFVIREDPLIKDLK